MKKILLIFLICFSQQCFAQQPDDNLFQTWYLTYLHSSDTAPEYTILNVNPAINPTLTINEDYNFTGEAACNSFYGTFEFPVDDTFQRTDFASTDVACEVDIHTFFESAYFNMLEGGWFTIMPEDDGMVLTMENAIFGIAIFKTIELATTNYEFEELQVYPNPTSSKLFVNSNNTILNTIDIVNINGKLQKSFSGNISEIDISDLSAGMYILQIHTALGIVNKKIIKN